MAGCAANRHESFVHIARRLRVDDIFQRQDMIFHQIGDHVLGQIRICRGEKGAEVLRILDEIGDGFIFLGVVLGCNADGIIDNEADMLAP